MISAVILTKNSGAAIEKTLRSVRFCDEVVVIDDESTDDTRVISEKYRAKFIVHSLHEDFAGQRNFGLSEAKGQWVLFVDSDEIITNDLNVEIKNKTSKLGNCVGYYIKRQDEMWGKTLRHGETANVRLLRLARKDAGIWVRPVHEVWDVKGNVAELTNPLIHYPHPTVREFLSNVNRYSTVNANVFFDEGVRVNFFSVITYPVGKFIYNYFFRAGFLDGMPGLVIALMMSFHSFLTRGKIWELQRKNR
jgi:glycosyltransferase involved in cell wall biosynthesis